MMLARLNTKRFNNEKKIVLWCINILIIRAEADRSNISTDEEQLKSWMLDFIASINMKVFMGPFVKTIQF